MIEISQIKLSATHTNEELVSKVALLLHVEEKNILSYQIIKRSMDARKKPLLYFIYTLAVAISNETQVLKKIHDKTICKYLKKDYQFPFLGETPLEQSPVIIGAGPCGLFAAYILSQKGYAPIVIERGEKVEERRKAVANFWKTGILNTESNVQFGEGGAGTFSDGKLSSQIKDKANRIDYCLETFVKFGANQTILYDNKPHIGTDVLTNVIINMRKEIERFGGKFIFNAKVTDFLVKDDIVQGVIINGVEKIISKNVVLAIGHSARDTFQVLNNCAIRMEAKPFAVGFRVEHEKEGIDACQLGNENVGKLDAATYKLSAKTNDNRGVYSFCMCPGGVVVNASSEEKALAINGMSYYARNEKNSNSAIVVQVNTKDFDGEDALAGVRFQQEIERRAFQLGNGKIPIQRYGDFVNNINSITENLEYLPCTKGEYICSNLRSILPEGLNLDIIEAMKQFGHSIKGFDNKNAILSGVESRTSSPIRIIRNEIYESNIIGLFPGGEGAGYAGGIMSAAVDGIKIAEQIIGKYQPLKGKIGE